MQSQGLRIAALSVAVFLSGCQTVATKQSTADFDTQFSQGDYLAASDTALIAGKIQPDGTSDNLYWSLQAAAALNAQGDYQQSTKIFDSAEILMKGEDTENIGKKGVEKVTAVLLNNSFNDYTPTVYDGVMVNTYKAVNYIMQKDVQNARIEFNRAADRQRRAIEHFKEKIKEQEEAVSKKEQERSKETSATAQVMDFEKSTSESTKTIYETYPELEGWKVYPDYVNPYTDYMHGLYFLLGSQDKSDFGKSRQSLRRVSGMMPDNKSVATDLMVVDNLQKGKWRKHKLNPAVWVVFENGQAPVIEENLIPIPLFLVSDKVEYMQVALPKLKMRSDAYSYLNISDGKNQIGKTEQLASIDRVIQTEFKKELPYKVTEAVASTMTKAFIQYQARKEGGLLGSLAGIVYQAATTHADTRSWTTLPKEVQIARVRKPKSGRIEVSAPELDAPISIDLPDSRFSIVFIKAPTVSTPPTYRVVGFDA
ncbi:COG3014 family protein [Motiliproteus sp.]|uniref:COG3014 family protein n=1 Tax=Motiliproteus sp. TaxID=1898955 RepID=UPI003BA8E26C